MVVLVYGGRDFLDQQFVSLALGVLLRRFGAEHLHIVQGGAPGADNSAFMWAIENCVPVTTFPADWERWGKKAGSRRNYQMKDFLRRCEDGGADVMACEFPGGPGTANMRGILLGCGVRVQVYCPGKKMETLAV
jgi:hypothetical protein